MTGDDRDAFALVGTRRPVVLSGRGSGSYGNKCVTRKSELVPIETGALVHVDACAQVNTRTDTREWSATRGICKMRCERAKRRKREGERDGEKRRECSGAALKDNKLPR